jgi:hypothetical protein
MPEGQAPERYGVEDPVPHAYISHLLYPIKGRRRPTGSELPAPVRAQPVANEMDRGCS